jgi:hypothetical protein
MKAVWEDQEVSLHRSAIHLFTFARSRQHVAIPCEFDPTHNSHLPSCDQLKPTKEDAKYYLQKALLGVRALMAMVSYAIALSTDPNDVPEHPVWAAYLQDEAGMDPGFMDNLKRSSMNDFTLT